MVDSRTVQQAFLLRSIAERLGQEPVKQLIKAPGMSAVYRIIVYYHDRQALDSVATMCELVHHDPELTLVYRGIFRERPIKHTIPRRRYEDFTQAMQQVQFDQLKDQPGMPQSGADFWMIERAAGTYVHSVIVAPETATGGHVALVHAVQSHLPEALRMISKE
jgi:hypothetical protein